MKSAIAICGSVFTALLCNACCWLPPILIAFGGAGAGVVSFLGPYRPLLLTLAAVQLAIGFYLAYRKPKDPCCASHAGRCDVSFRRRLNIGVMWGVAALVVGLNVIPFGSHAGHVVVKAMDRVDGERITLSLAGLDCGSCASSAEQRLLALPGVKSARVDLATAVAHIEILGEPPSTDQLQNALR
jgi:copper chaperone CopZ